MLRAFWHKGLVKLFMTGSAAGIRPEHARRLRLILSQLNAATSVKDMNLPGLRLHPLKGNLARVYSVIVSGNWRVVFRFDGPHVFDVDCVDYH